MATTDFSIKYLNKACLKLSDLIRDLAKEMPDVALEVVNDKGQKIQFSLSDIAVMLQDSKKILEFRLIDLIDSWASSMRNPLGNPPFSVGIPNSSSTVLA